jgi:hypothetical protein
MFHRSLKLLSAPVLIFVAGGCSRAPSVNLAGSFLPSWMLCLLGGFAVAGVMQWQLVRRKLQYRVAPVVVFYPSLVVATACLLWLLFFR